MVYLVTLTLIFPFAFAIPGLLYYCYNQTRAHGYRAPSAAAAVTGSWAAVTSLIYYFGPTSLWHRTDNLSIYFLLLFFFWFPALLSTAFSLVLIRFVLPRRNARSFGARRVRFPFQRLGQAVVGLAALIAIFCLLALILNPADYSGSLSGLVLDSFLLFLGYYLMHVGRRCKPAVVPNPLQLKTDAAVGALYLRSFKQESQPFAIGPKEKCGPYASSWVARMDDGYGNVHLTFEQFFANLLTERIGAFVALGSPEDYIAPEGAMRVYAKDSDWTEWLHDLANRAICILVEFGQSENLHWEFEHLRCEGLQQKLFVLTQPTYSDSAAFPRAYRSALSRLKGIRPVSWREFSRGLAKLGYNLNFEDPGPGSVIGFDENGRGVLLTTEAELPPDFVEPICVWLEGKDLGRLPKPIRCLSCGHSFHAPSSYDGTLRTRFCKLCEEGLTPAEHFCRQFAFVFWAIFGALISIGIILAPEGSWMERHPSGMALGILLGGIAVAMLIEKKYKKRIAERLVGKYRDLANGGDAVAMFRLSQLYSGVKEGLPTDNSAAVDWCRKAAELGDAKAMSNLGALYHKGESGVPKDQVQALNWYRKAASVGEPCAMNNIGNMYEDGEGGLPNDLSEAIKWYQAAAKLNLPTAKNNLERIRNVRETK